jgi:hypothetical protein
MLIRDLVKTAGPQAEASCGGGCASPAAVEMHGYVADGVRLNLCAECALQLARKILEDLCELHTHGGRHG